MKAIVTVVGKDQVGIIAGVCNTLADHNINVLDISQTIMEGFFTMMMVVDLALCAESFANLQNVLKTFGEPPSPGVGNLALTQGPRSRAELIAEMGTGLLVTSMIGSTINPTTGDYSRGAAGFWVEDGEIAYPVNECTIAGNLRQMLRDFVAANDARTHLATRVPSILIEGMTLAGT